MVNEIQIPYDIYRKIFCYAEIAAKDSNEIMFLLKLQEIDEGGLFLEDVILPEQEVGGASCELKTGKWMKSIKKDDWQYIRGWGHSHCRMGVFHSSTDDDTLIDKWNGESKHSSPYGVSLVVSLPSNMKAWITYYKPFALEKVEMPINVLNPPASDDIVKHCETEVKDRVKKWTYQQNWNYKKFDPDTCYPSSAGSETGKTYLEDLDTDPEDPEESIIDPETGWSIAILKEYEMWDPQIYPDLVQKLEAAKKKFRKVITEKPCPCPHIFLNNKQRWICFFSGKSFDCETCKHNPSKSTKETSPVIERLPPPPEDKSSSEDASSEGAVAGSASPSPS